MTLPTRCAVMPGETTAVRRIDSGGSLGIIRPGRTANASNLPRFSPASFCRKVSVSPFHRRESLKNQSDLSGSVSVYLPLQKTKRILPEGESLERCWTKAVAAAQGDSTLAA